jgi:hypothetical protein
MPTPPTEFDIDPHKRARLTMAAKKSRWVAIESLGWWP